jgi:hypothetical protein
VAGGIALFFGCPQHKGVTLIWRAPAGQIRKPIRLASVTLRSPQGISVGAGTVRSHPGRLPAGTDHAEINYPVRPA